MGIQTQNWGSIGSSLRIQNMLSILKSSTTYVLTSVFFIVSLLAYEYAFANDTANQAVSTQRTATAANQTSTTRSGFVSQADIDTLVIRVDALNEEKAQLDNQWRIERNRYDSTKIRIDDSKKTIRLEMDEVLLNNSPRDRLDGLLSQHEALSKDSKEVAKKVAQLEEKLTAHQLLSVQAHRDLDSMRTRYVAQQREQDLQRVQEITRFLDRELRFSENVSFKCSTNKSLTACLNGYPLDARIQNWVQDHYQEALFAQLAGKVDSVKLSSDWYSTQISRNFTDATINLDGSVSAEVEINAIIMPRKMMACALLKAPADLCAAQSASLIVRSNKYGDQVYINDKPYGSTPLSVMLDPGEYNVEVKFKGLTQKRTLTLDENRHLNFVF